MRDILGFEGRYAITEKGLIWSYPQPTNNGGLRHRGRWVKVRKHYRLGYKIASLYVAPGKCVTKFVHRLLAATYIPNPLGLPEVNHKDFNRQNNAIGNLEWCTHQYNMEHARKGGRMGVVSGAVMASTV